MLAAYVLMAGFQPLSSPERAAPRRLLALGALMGLAILCDYTGVPLLLAFGVWALLEGRQAAGAAAAVRAGAWYSLGAAGPVALLLAYQWIAFGSPWLPAQSYMPPTEYSVQGWHGFSWPSAALLWQNLFSPHYGLFVFSPMLAAAILAPLVRERQGGPTRRELLFIFGATLGLYLFNSANNFAFLQWNTGVRYMVPAAPLLFFALVPVLRSARRGYVFALIALTLIVSWSVTMVREDVRSSLVRILSSGPQLPWLSALRRTASAYAPFFEAGASALPVLAVVAVALWLLWRRRRSPAAQAAAST